MLMYQVASKMRKLQEQGLSQKEAANQLGIITRLGGVDIIARSKSSKKK